MCWQICSEGRGGCCRCAGRYAVRDGAVAADDSQHSHVSHVTFSLTLLLCIITGNR